VAYSGVVRDVRRAVALEKPRRMPVFACSEEFDVKWYGRYPYEQVCQSGGLIAEVWAAAIEEFDYDWAWVQVDDCFELEPLGVVCRGEGDILRATVGHLPATAETVRGLRVPDPGSAGRMPEKLEAIRLLKKRFGDAVLIEGSCAAPYSAAGLLFGLEEAMVMGLSEPDLLSDTCAFFVEAQTRYIKAQIEAGADAIWLGDCNAFSAMLSVEQYRHFALPSCRALVENAHAAGALVHLHVSEVSIPHLLAETDLGVDIINCGPAANIAEVRKALTGLCCFSGNLDPIEVLMRGSPAEVERDTERIMSIGCSGGGYLFNTGEMNPRDVPVQNMRAMIRAARRVAASGACG
jgi:uroporphyrinogen decarboxylase